MRLRCVYVQGRADAHWSGIVGTACVARPCRACSGNEAGGVCLGEGGAGATPEELGFFVVLSLPVRAPLGERRGESQRQRESAAPPALGCCCVKTDRLSVVAPLWGRSAGVVVVVARASERARVARTESSANSTNLHKIYHAAIGAPSFRGSLTPCSNTTRFPPTSSSSSSTSTICTTPRPPAISRRFCPRAAMPCFAPWGQR